MPKQRAFVWITSQYSSNESQESVLASLFPRLLQSPVRLGCPIRNLFCSRCMSSAVHQLEDKEVCLLCVEKGNWKEILEMSRKASVPAMLMNCCLLKCYSLHFLSRNYSFLDGEAIRSLISLQMLRNITHISKTTVFFFFFFFSLKASDCVTVSINSLEIRSCFSLRKNNS